MENTEHMHGELENVEYYLVGLHLKFVPENGGEHKAHGEQENMEYYLAS